MQEAVHPVRPSGGLQVVAERVWSWLACEEDRALLTAKAETYARSPVDPDGPVGRLRRSHRHGLAGVPAAAQRPDVRDTAAGQPQRTSAHAVPRGALLDVLATGDVDQTTAAVHDRLGTGNGVPSGRMPD